MMFAIQLSASTPFNRLSSSGDSTIIGESIDIVDIIQRNKKNQSVHDITLNSTTDHISDDTLIDSNVDSISTLLHSHSCTTSLPDPMLYMKVYKTGEKIISYYAQWNKYEYKEIECTVEIPKGYRLCCGGSIYPKEEDGKVKVWLQEGCEYDFYLIDINKMVPIKDEDGSSKKYFHVDTCQLLEKDDVFDDKKVENENCLNSNLDLDSSTL